MFFPDKKIAGNQRLTCHDNCQSPSHPKQIRPLQLMVIRNPGAPCVIYIYTLEVQVDH